MTVYKNSDKSLWMSESESVMILVLKSSDGSYSEFVYRKDSTDIYDQRRISDIHSFVRSRVMSPDDDPPEEVLQLCGNVNLV